MASLRLDCCVVSILESSFLIVIIAHGKSEFVFGSKINGVLGVTV